MNRKTFYIWVIGLLIPIAFQNVITYSSGLADNLMLGSYNEYSMGAVSVANQIQYLIQMVILAIGEGAVILCSRFWGTKNYGQIKTVFRFVLKLSFVFSVFIFGVTFFFARTIMGFFTTEDMIIQEGIRYLQIVSFSYFFYCISNTILAVLRSIEVVNIGFMISLFSLSIDVTLNYAFIFGKWGFPEMGVAGAAVTTVLGKMIELGLLIVYLRHRHPNLCFKLKELMTGNRQLMKPYFTKTYPILIGNSVWGIALASQTAIIGMMGVQTISANSIGTTVFQILTVFIYAAASVSNVVTSKTIGQKDYHLVKIYARRLQVLYLLLGVITGLAIFCSRFVILDFYQISSMSAKIANQFLLVLSVTSIGTAFQMACSTGILRGGGDTRFVLITDLFFMWVIVLPLSFLLARASAAPWLVYCCLKSDQLLKIPVFAWRVNRFKWLNNEARQEVKVALGSSISVNEGEGFYEKTK
ncbi:MATE family efflux transporter [Enterococcus sp. AZ109]|uniref:MATE family efflux transporter n=1 Tax=Enterococcus sp. AZ109 TaxID=2774634 RepID=UPI003F200DA2